MTTPGNVTDHDVVADFIINLRKRMIAAGVVQASKFSWEKTAEETVALYKKVLKSTAAPQTAQKGKSTSVL